jgi:hypothetical protein
VTTEPLSETVASPDTRAADTTDRPPAVSSGSLSLARTSNCCGVPGPKIDRGVGHRVRWLVRPLGDPHEKASERDRALGVGHLIVDGRVAGLAARHEPDRVADPGGRAQQRCRRRHELEVGVVSVSVRVPIVGDDVDGCRLAHFDGEGVVGNHGRQVRDHRLTNRHDDRR